MSPLPAMDAERELVALTFALPLPAIEIVAVCVVRSASFRLPEPLMAASNRSADPVAVRSPEQRMVAANDFSFKPLIMASPAPFKSIAARVGVVRVTFTADRVLYEP